MYFLKDLKSTAFISSEEICASNGCDYCEKGGRAKCRHNYTEDFEYSEEFENYLEDYLQDMINRFEYSTENGKMEYFADNGDLYWRDLPSGYWEKLDFKSMRCDELIDEINSLSQLLY